MSEVLYNTAGALLSYIPYFLSTSPTSPAPASPPDPSALPYASHNLRHYVATAIIPDMVLAPTAQTVPEAGRKSHLNHLKVQHESYRVLESMQRIGDFGALARKCMFRLSCNYLSAFALMAFIQSVSASFPRHLSAVKRLIPTSRSLPRVTKSFPDTRDLPTRCRSEYSAQAPDRPSHTLAASWLGSAVFRLGPSTGSCSLSTQRP